MPDKRRKHIDPVAEAERRAALYAAIDQQRLSLQAAVREMRALSRLTQAEFAKHRGISLATLKQIESGVGQPRADTLNKIGEIFGLEVGFVRRSRKTDPASPRP
jgi:transcriptional regulator with XRE-family HTH domain